MHIQHSSYNKSNMILHIQQQRSHYERILNPKSVIKSYVTRETSRSLYHSNKKEIYIRKGIEKQNAKICSRLVRIKQSNKGFDSFLRQEHKKNNEYRKNLNTTPMFIKQIRSLSKKNELIVQLIDNATPRIAVKQQIQKHEEQYKKLSENISFSNKKNTLNSNNLLKKTIPTLRQNFYHEKIKGKKIEEQIIRKQKYLQYLAGTKSVMLEQRQKQLNTGKKLMRSIDIS